MARASSHRIGCILFQDLFEDGAAAPPVELCELFLRLSPIIALRREPPFAVFLDFRGIDTDASDFESRLRLKVEALLRRRSGSVGAARFRIGLAENAGFALLHAEHPEGLTTRLSPTVLEHLLDPFGVARASQRPSPGQIASWLKLLGQLGIHTLRDFSLLPPSALASRFGRNGLEFSRRLREATSSADLEAWPVFIPPEKLLEVREFAPDQPLPSLLDPILFVSKELLDRLSARLRARMLRAAAIRIELHHEGRRDREPLVIRFCTPQGSVAGMLPSFRERLAHWLGQTEGEDSPLYGREVLGVALEVIETAPGHRSQRDFFHSHEDQAESWDSLISRLSEKIGPKARFQVLPVERHLPEKSWAVCEPRFTATDPLTPTPTPPPEAPATRPTRLLREPIILEHHEGVLHWPAACDTPGRRRQVLEWLGPERICEGWWETEAIEHEAQRDYFRAICRGGVQLWGYFEAAPERFHLQGYFD